VVATWREVRTPALLCSSLPRFTSLLSSAVYYGGSLLLRVVAVPRFGSLGNKLRPQSRLQPGWEIVRVAAEKRGQEQNEALFVSSGS